MGKSHEVVTRHLSEAEGKRRAVQKFNRCVEESGMNRRTLRDHCREQLELEKEGSRSITTPEMHALFLLSENRCPIDGLELIPDTGPESSEYVCPEHGWQTGYRYRERGDQVKDYLGLALSSVESGLSFPDIEGLGVIKILSLKPQT